MDSVFVFVLFLQMFGTIPQIYSMLQIYNYPEKTHLNFMMCALNCIRRGNKLVIDHDDIYFFTAAHNKNVLRTSSRHFSEWLR